MDNKKEYLLDTLTLEWTKLDNKVRFIEEIISGDLVIQNRKKVDIVEDLKLREYAPMRKTADPNILPGDVEAPSETDVGGYDYLLGMPLWSLTWERVQHLMKEREEKAAEVNYLTSQSAQDLWRIDLAEFMIQFDIYESKLADLESQTPGKKATGKKGVTKGKAAKKLISEDESDVSEADYEVKKKAVKKEPVAVKKPTIARKVVVKEIKVEPQPEQTNALSDSAAMQKKRDDLKLKLQKFIPVDEDMKSPQKRVLSDQDEPEPKKRAIKRETPKGSGDEIAAPNWTSKIAAKPNPKAVKKVVPKAVKKVAGAVLVESDDLDVVEVVKKKPVARKAPIKKAVVRSESEEDEDVVKKVVTKRAPLKKAMILTSESEDMAVVKPSRGRGKPVAKYASDESEENEESYVGDSGSD